MEGVTYEQFRNVLGKKKNWERGIDPKIKEIWVPLPVLILAVEKQPNYLISVLQISPSPLLLLLLSEHTVYFSCSTLHG